MKNEIINKQSDNLNITVLNGKFAGTDQAMVTLYMQAYNEYMDINVIRDKHRGANLGIKMIDVSSASRIELISEINNIISKLESSPLSKQTTDEVLQDSNMDKRDVNTMKPIIENTDKTEINHDVIYRTDVLNNLTVTQLGINNEDAVLLPKNEDFTNKIAIYPYSTLR